MAVTTLWAPNQAAIAQVETYTFSAPTSVGNTYNAVANGKTLTYTSVSGDTAATAATGLFNLLSAQTSVPPELTEVTFANPSDGVVTATANVPGTPFANVSGTSAGLVLSTGNGLVSGISTAHTRANQSPSDVNDAQNWLRFNLATTPPAQSRALPQNGDDVVVNNSDVPLLWNLDQLATVQFATFTRWQSFTGTIGLPENNPGGYAEWRATNFKFVGPQGSLPAGGLVMVAGYGSGSGPTRERYDLGSQKFALQALAAGIPADEYSIRIKGVHTDNTITAVNGVSVGVAMLAGELAKINSISLSGGATVGVGVGVTFTTSTSGTTSSVTAHTGLLLLNASPAALTLSLGARAVFTTDGLTWASIAAQGTCILTWLAGGTVTTLTMTTGCTLDKSGDLRALTITNATIDGDTCVFNDPNNAITWTNAVTVKQQVTTGPFLFTGSRTVKVT